MIRNALCTLFALAAMHAHAADLSPYAGDRAREIKALSAQQAEDYLAGRGMGMARAAELNGYPGPAHVLELAEPLGLSAAQREQTETLFGAMQRDAKALGEQLVAAERDLDRLFAQRLARRETLRPMLERINTLQGELRAVHLEAHLAQRALLDPDQVAHYQRLRGYDGDTVSDPGNMRHHHRAPQ